jgi:hypothetical protein
MLEKEQTNPFFEGEQNEKKLSFVNSSRCTYRNGLYTLCPLVRVNPYEKRHTRTAGLRIRRVLSSTCVL